MEERGDQRVQIFENAAEYLATINLSKNGAVEVRPEDAAAPEGPRDEGDLHRIRPAARDDLAA